MKGLAVIATLAFVIGVAFVFNGRVSHESGGHQPDYIVCRKGPHVLVIGGESYRRRTRTLQALERAAGCSAAAASNS